MINLAEENTNKMEALKIEAFKNPVSGLPDRPTLSSAELKKAFDSNSEELRAALNGLIDILKGLEGAAVVFTAEGISIEDALGNRVRWDGEGVKYIRLNSDRVLETSEDGEHWEATGSSGHLILDKDGQQMPQRARLYFDQCEVSDDGERTVIHGIVGPQGLQGPQGEQGIQGPKGETGQTGCSIVPRVNQSTGLMEFQLMEQAVVPASVNVRGPQGPQGVTGATGPMGPTGATGPVGATGPRGLEGPQGPRGAQGVSGEPGPAGPQGPQGPQGIQGPRGADGKDGKSLDIKDSYPTLEALEADFPNGTDGAFNIEENGEIHIWSELYQKWKSIGALQGPQGPMGPQGPQGIQGVPGVDGAQGPAGPEGPQGIQGIQGPKGDTGATGATGATGPQGAAGVDGKSAYTIAQEAGYGGTEAALGEALAQTPDHVGNGDIHVTAAQKKAWTNKAEKSDIRMDFENAMNWVGCTYSYTKGENTYTEQWKKGGTLQAQKVSTKNASGNWTEVYTRYENGVLAETVTVTSTKNSDGTWTVTVA